MYLMGLNANLMSLAGIAISIGVLVDGAIVEVENAYNKIYLWQAGGKKGDFHHVRLEALVGSGAVGVLLVAGHRGGFHAGFHAGRPGGPTVQAAGLLEEPGHGHRRAAGHHAGSSHAHAVRARSSPSASGRGRSRGWPAKSAGRQILLRGAAPHQPPLAPDLRAAMSFRGPPRQGHGDRQLGSSSR